MYCFAGLPKSLTQVVAVLFDVSTVHVLSLCLIQPPEMQVMHHSLSRQLRWSSCAARLPLRIVSQKMPTSEGRSNMLTNILLWQPLKNAPIWSPFSPLTHMSPSIRKWVALLHLSIGAVLDWQLIWTVVSSSLGWQWLFHKYYQSH